MTKPVNLTYLQHKSISIHKVIRNAILREFI